MTMQDDLRKAERRYIGAFACVSASMCPTDEQWNEWYEAEKEYKRILSEIEAQAKIHAEE